MTSVDRVYDEKDVEASHETRKAMQANDHGLGIDRAMEQRVVRKIDRNLVPLVTFAYLISFLDRSNIGNAKIAGMSDDLKLTGNKYNNLLTLFYIGYVVFQFQVLGWKRFKPHHFGTYAVFAWGVIATCQSATQSYAGEMVLRLLLGIFEAAFGPGSQYTASSSLCRADQGHSPVSTYVLLSSSRSRHPYWYFPSSRSSRDVFCRRSRIWHHFGSPGYRQLAVAVPGRGHPDHTSGTRYFLLLTRFAAHSPLLGRG